MNTLKKIGTLITTSALCIYSGISAQAHNSPAADRERVIHIQAQASTLIANDELYATLYIEEQHALSADVARNLTNAMNAALAQAKRYSAVTANTGSQSTYPMYYKNGKIRGWQGRAEIELHSKNFEQASELIADLQKTLKMGNLNFRVSEETRERTETTLMADASKNFQARARSLLSVWNASDYQLINLNLNTSGSYRQPRAYAAKMEMSADANLPTQQFAGGESRITVTANGSIQLR